MAGGSDRVSPAREGLEDAVQVGRTDARPGVFDLEHRHVAHMGGPKAHAALLRELDGVAQHVDQDLRQAPFVGLDQPRGTHHIMLKVQPLADGLQLEQLHDLLQVLAQAHGLGLQRQLAGFDAGDVQRAFDQAQQVFTTAPNDAHALFAVRGHGRVFVQQLCIAQDAVERRAQLVADGADVAGLGLVGGVGRPFGALQFFVGAAVAVDLFDQGFGLPVAFLLRHAAADLRQHQPPCDDAAHQQERTVGLDEGRTQRGGCGLQRLRVQLAQFHLVKHHQQHRQGRRHHGHQHQVAAQAGVQLRPPSARGQTFQQGVELLVRARALGLAQVVAAGVERTAQAADGPAIGRTLRHVFRLIAAFANDATPLHTAAQISAAVCPRQWPGCAGA